MTHRIFAIVLTVVLQSVKLLAHEYALGDNFEKGDVFEKDGISYKVLVTYLVVDPKESPDTIKGPEKFYKAGELMVVKVDEKLGDVVIPPSINRFKVIGLTDSLFYQHEHDRIWLPNLLFAGNGCFAKLKVRSGTLVIHDIANMGMGVFDELDAELLLDITRNVNWGKTFSKMRTDSSLISSRPKGLVRLNRGSLKYIKGCPVYNECYSAVADNYKKWVRKAFCDDERFQKNDLVDKNGRLSKRMYSTTPQKAKNGLKITANAVDIKGLGYPWGNLSQKYTRQANYAVYDKKTRKTTYYQEFIPVADPLQKTGWYVKFIGKEGEVKYMLNGKLIKK